MSARSRLRLSVVACMLAAALLVGWRLGVQPLGDWDEALTGARSVGLLETGHGLVVTFNGEPDFRKPPLYYWLTAMLYSFGGVSELTTRLPGAIAAVASVALMFAVGRWVGGSMAGAFAAVAWMTTPFFIGHSRQAQPDLVLYSAVLGGLLAWLNSRFVVAGLILAAAILTKGVAALLGPFMFGLWACFTLDFGFLRSRRFWLGLLLAGAIVAVWVVGEWLLTRSAFHPTFVGANRILWTSPFGPTGAYYWRVGGRTLAELPVVALLWLIAAFFALRSREPSAWRRQALVPAMLAAGVLALATSHPKNAHYILVLALGLSVAAGTGLAAVVEQGPWSAYVAVTLPIALALHRFATIGHPALTAPFLAVPLLVGAGFLAATTSSLGKARGFVAILWLFATALAAAGTIGEVATRGRPNKGLQQIAADVQREVPKDAVVLVDAKALQGAVFYTRRRVEKLSGFFFRDGAGPSSVYALVRKGHELGIAGYSTAILAERGGIELVRFDHEPGGLPRGPRVIVRGADPRTRNALALLGADLREAEKNGFTSYVVVTHPPLASQLLPRDHWTIVGAPAGAQDAIDGNARTHWTVAASQEPGLAVTLDLGRIETASGVRLLTSAPRSFPAGLAVRESSDGREWREIVSLGEFHPGYHLTQTGLAYDRDYDIEVRFAPRRLRWLRFEVTVGRPNVPWSLAEIEVWGEPGSGEGPESAPRSAFSFSSPGGSASLRSSTGMKPSPERARSASSRPGTG